MPRPSGGGGPSSAPRDSWISEVERVGSGILGNVVLQLCHGFPKNCGKENYLSLQVCMSHIIYLCGF